MKTIHLYIPANHFLPELPGGSLQYLRYGPYLRERGIKITVLTSRKPEHDIDNFEINGIEVRRVSIPEPNDFLEDLLALTKIAAEEIKRSNIRKRACIQPIGTFAYSRRSVLEMWRIRSAGIPLLRHFTEVPELVPCSRTRSLRNRLSNRVGLSPYSRLLMCSYVMGRAFQAFSGISDRRIEVIPNGIDRDVFRPGEYAAKPDRRRALGLPVEGPLVLSVCSITSRKGVDLLVEAWERVLAKHPDATFAIVGSDFVRPTLSDSTERKEAADFIEKIRFAISRLSRPGSVILTGEVADVEEYYHAADLFVFASLKEGLPSAVLEAMSSGLPAVLAPFHGFPEPGEEYGTPGIHFIPVSHDPGCIAEAINRLLESPEERSRIGFAAAAWIDQTQRMDHAADRLAAVYRSVSRDA